MRGLLIVLALAASIPPLLTLTSLWQIKEWRIDRLREHLRSEGVFRQLFGLLRPATFIVILATGIAMQRPAEEIAVAVLVGLIALGIAQTVLRRQPHPVWTQKAITLFTGSMFLTGIFAYLLASAAPPTGPFVLAALPLLQVATLCTAWSVFLPVDTFLKRRILHRARALREAHPEVTVIGITGSVGKTTTKELLAHLLRAKGARATPAYVNSEIGVARWMANILSADPPSILIVEMGAYRRGEIALLCAMTQPTVGIVTFVGEQHRALFGSIANLREAKGELVQSLPDDGLAILNADSEITVSLQDRALCPVIRVSTGDRADMTAEDIEETAEGVRFSVQGISFTVPLHGTHNVKNILLACAAAQRFGVTLAGASQILRSFRPPDHTFAVRTSESVTVLDDTHNASPASFQAAIEWAKAQPTEEKILLTSGLIELGEAEDRILTELGAQASTVFDRVIFLHRRNGSAFARGFGKPIATTLPRGMTAPPRSLVACVGRIPPRILRAFLP